MKVFANGLYVESSKFVQKTAPDCTGINNKVCIEIDEGMVAYEFHYSDHRRYKS